MKNITMPAYALLCAALTLIAAPATAEQSEDLGEYVVHYNAVNSDVVPPRVAQLYGITRSNNRGMLTITVLKKHMKMASLPVSADVQASAVSLSNQRKSLSMREIRDGGAIYYVGQFPISNNETLRFDLEVTPDNGTTHTIEFRQQFFTH